MACYKRMDLYHQQQDRLKRRLTSINLHGIASRKNEIVHIKGKKLVRPAQLPFIVYGESSRLNVSTLHAVERTNFFPLIVDS